MQAEAWDTEARLAQLRARRKRRARSRLVRRAGLVALGILAFVALVGAFAYGGSSGQLAEGVTIAGVDVGGLSAAEATAELERREASLARTPLSVTADGRTYTIRPAALGVSVNWQGAVAEAQSSVGGLRPLRGLRRFATRAFGTEIAPTATANPKALDRLLNRMGRNDAPHRDAAVRLVGLRAVIVPARPGRVIDRTEAKARILGTFASLDRSPVTVPAETDEPTVTAAALEPALAQVRTAMSAPVTLRLGSTRYRLTRGEIGRVLALPADGRQALRIGGPGADAYFATLSRRVNTPARNATFIVASAGRVLVKPSMPARALDVPRTAKRLFAAALSPSRRVATIVVGTKQPARTTAEARRMGVTGLVSSYTTIYGGDVNRVHNVRLVAQLIDDTLVGPGRTFSFNDTTGERNASKGFLEAPVIINGELQTGLGGGVCQVSTTVFNAAYEAGLDITARTNHALYISHYPQGRDATVNYPDTDLKFVNDTSRWLLVRTFVGSSSLTVNLYGTPQNRRVESEVAPLETVGNPPTTWRKDPTIAKGRRVVSDAGSSPLATSVHRRVYNASGKLLYDNVWYSSYRGEKKIVLVGTKPKPEPEKKKDATEQPADAPVDGPGI